ncbi:MAG: hypothetical protein JSR85_00140 [Proteobacteria bacterium]|nr:hypothetical protein [Pseudomonadota bacterium]
MITKFSQSVKSMGLITMVSSLALMNAVYAGGGSWKETLQEQKENIGALTTRCVRGIDEIEKGVVSTSTESAARISFKKERWKARLEKCMTLHGKIILEPEDYLDLASVDEKFALKTHAIAEETAAPSPAVSIDQLGKEQMALSAFLSEKDYSSAFTATKATATDASDEDIVKFHLTSNGYANWEDLLPKTKTWVVTNIKGAAQRKELEAFLSEKDYAVAFAVTRATTDASDEEIVKHHLTSNGYGKWADLLPETKKWVVTNIKGAAQRKELAEFLSKKDYAGAFAVTKATTDASDEEIVKHHLTSNGYGKWSDLLPETKKWVVTNIKGAAQRKELEAFLSKKDYAGAFAATKATTESSDKEIVKFLLTSNGYGKWSDLLPKTRAWVVTKVKTAKEDKTPKLVEVITGGRSEGRVKHNVKTEIDRFGQSVANFVDGKGLKHDKKLKKEDKKKDKDK